MNLKHSDIVLHPLLHASVNFSFRLFFGGAVAFVVKLFAAAKPDFNLDVPAGKIKRQRNEGIPLLVYRAHKLKNLPLVHEKLSVAERFTVEDVALFIRAYVHSDKQKLAFDDIAVGILEVYRAVSDAFYLGAVKSDAGLIFSSTK